MQKWIKASIVCLMAITLLGSGAVSAATKVETAATNQYTALKAGMTMEQVAKVLYGKDFKKQLTTKNGSQVLKMKEVLQNTSGESKEIYYELYDRKVKTPPTFTGLAFMTKKNDSVYRLVFKELEIGRDSYSKYRESTRKVNSGAKIKFSMTEKQLDGILSGTGLGEWGGVMEADIRSVYSKAEIKAGEASEHKGKTYIFQKSTKSRVYVDMTYDAKKKTYIVEDYQTF